MEKSKKSESWLNYLSLFCGKVPEGDSDVVYEDKRDVEAQLENGEIVDQCDVAKDGVVTLSESPKIVYYSDQLEGGSLYKGKFGDRLATFKLVSKLASSSEHRLLSNLDQCDNVIRYICTIDCPTFHYIITEPYQRSLQFCVQENEMEKKQILREVSFAVRFLHQRNILHLNMNSESVRFVIESGIKRIKLSDFSHAIELTVNCKTFIDGSFGAEGFTAPELKSQQEAYFPCDIYSLGCLIFYVITGGKKFPTIRSIIPEWKYFIKIRKISNNQDCEGVLSFSLLKKILRLHEDKRISINEIIEHPFFWDTQKIFNVILDIVKRFEDAIFKESYQKSFETNQEQVIGDDWKVKLDFTAHTSNYDSKSLLGLVKVIRNLYVHNRDALSDFVGRSDEELMKYFLGKFPQLSNHLHRWLRTIA